MLVGQQIPAPIGGVTQVPPKHRAPGMLTEAVNTFASPQLGLGMRNGTDVLTPSLDLASPSTGKAYEWSPGRGERYKVFFSAGGVVVVDVLSGAQYTPVLTDTGHAVDFFGTDPRFSTAIMGDEMYVIRRGYNRAAWSIDQSAKTQLFSRSLLTVVELLEGTTFTVIVDGSSYVIPVSYIAISGVFAQTPEFYAAQQIVAALQTHIGGTYYVGQLAGTASVEIRKLTGGVVFVSVTSDKPYDTVTTVNSEVSTEDELPSTGVPGMVIHVKAGDYWMRWDQPGFNPLEGKWGEVASPYVNVQLLNYRMPWVLKRALTGSTPSFTFGPTTWAIRGAGDDSNNPLPTLYPIDALFTAESRLGMTSGPTVVLSATSTPTQIFRKVVAQLLPSDPINVKTALGPESAYHGAVEWDNGQFLWSDRAQIRISGEPVLTPTTIAMRVESRFENSAQCAPIVLGSRVYFARAVEGFTRIYEYWRPPGYNMPPMVTDITESVPTYLHGNPKGLVGDEALGVLVVHTEHSDDTAQEHIFVCHFDRDGNGAIRPRWHTWKFPGADIHAVQIIGGVLYLTLTRGGVTQVEKLNIANPANTAHGIPKDADDTVDFEPSITIDNWYIVDEKGNQIDTRFTIRDLIFHHQHTRKASVSVCQEVNDRLTLPDDGNCYSGELRLPMLRSNYQLKITLKWYGLLTAIHMNGHSRSRGRRM